ncbi:MAG: alpha/beta hydrolase [Pseudomonadota bacterium]
MIDGEHELSAALIAFLRSPKLAEVVCSISGTVHVRFAPKTAAATGRLISCSLSTFNTLLNEMAAPAHLTEAEMRLALQLVSGLELVDAAKLDGVGYETKRSHLKAVMQKLGVSRQRSVIAVIMTAVLAVLLETVEAKSGQVDRIDVFLGRFGREQFRAGRVVAKSGGIHRYIEMGAPNGAPIVALHPAMLVLPSSKVVARAVELNLRIIIPLRPGTVSTDPAGSDFYAHTDLVLEGIDACIDLWCPSGAHVISFLNADFFAVRYAHSRPNKVKSLSLVASVQRMPPKGASRLRDAILKFALRDRSTFRMLLRGLAQRLTSVERFISFSRFVYKEGSSDRRMLELQLEEPDKAEAMYCALMASQSSFIHDISALTEPLQQWLTSVRVPIVFYHGDDDKFHPVAKVRSIVDRLDSAQLVEIRDCGQLVDNQALNEVLNDFANRSGE